MIGGRRLLGKYIHGGGAQTTGFQSVRESRFVNQPASCGIDQNSSGLHPFDKFCVDKVRVFFCKRAVERDKIGLYGCVRLFAVHMNFHSQRLRDFRDPSSDLAIADNPQGFALQKDEGFFPVAEIRAVVPVAFFYRGVMKTYVVA